MPQISLAYSAMVLIMIVSIYIYDIGQLLPVRAELAAAGNVVYGHLCPLGRVPVDQAHHVLAGDVGLVVRQGQEPVVVQQHIHQILELSFIARSEESVSDHVNNLEKQCI